MAFIIGGVSTVVFGLFMWRLGKGMAYFYRDMTDDTKQ